MEKRIISMVLAILISFNIFPIPVSAATTIEISELGEYRGMGGNVIKIGVGDEYRLIAITSSSKTVSWKTDDKTVATVSKDGKVKGLKVGKATITATVDKVTAEIYIVVQKKSTEQAKKQKKLYKKAHEIIDTYTKITNTPFENEIAIHDYLTENVVYDSELLKRSFSDADDSFSAYGALINGKAVCSGYAKAFKLLMDILEIDCKIVSGTANNGTGRGYVEHAWNMVKLDDEWYNIDVTWDDRKDAIGRSYFNITDSMLSADHEWNTKNYPKATGTKYDYVKYFELEINSLSDLESFLTEKVKNLEESFELYCSFDISYIQFKEILKACIVNEHGRHGGLQTRYSYEGAYYMWFKPNVKYIK